MRRAASRPRRSAALISSAQPSHASATPAPRSRRWRTGSERSRRTSSAGSTARSAARSVDPCRRLRAISSAHSPSAAAVTIDERRRRCVATRRPRPQADVAGWAISSMRSRRTRAGCDDRGGGGRGQERRSHRRADAAPTLIDDVRVSDATSDEAIRHGARRASAPPAGRARRRATAAPPRRSTTPVAARRRDRRGR